MYGVRKNTIREIEDCQSFWPIIRNMHDNDNDYLPENITINPCFIRVWTSCWYGNTMTTQKNRKTPDPVGENLGHPKLFLAKNILGVLWTWKMQKINKSRKPSPKNLMMVDVNNKKTKIKHNILNTKNDVIDIHIYVKIINIGLVRLNIHQNSICCTYCPTGGRHCNIST